MRKIITYMSKDGGFANGRPASVSQNQKKMVDATVA
jgi:hypothetical protein